jgi:hypothetical protein
VCLERLPLIAPELNVIQAAMKDALLKHEVSKSLYSDHEMKHFEDVARALRLASKSGEVDDKDIENAAKQTAQDYEDVSLKELQEEKAKATFAGRRTKDENCRKSSNRYLDRRLLLLMKASCLGQSHPWLLPMAKHDFERSDSLRSTAEKAVRDNLGDTYLSNIVFIGNCPSSVYTYRYPIKARDSFEGKVGGKIFFFKSHVVDPTKFSKVQLEQGFNNQKYEWLIREEAKEIVSKEGNSRYWNRLEDSLLFESLREDIVNVIVKRLRRKLNSASNRNVRRAARQQSVLN